MKFTVNNFSDFYSAQGQALIDEDLLLTGIKVHEIDHNIVVGVTLRENSTLKCYLIEFQEPVELPLLLEDKSIVVFDYLNNNMEELKSAISSFSNNN
jgi:hypothetical protein